MSIDCRMGATNDRNWAINLVLAPVLLVLNWVPIALHPVCGKWLLRATFSVQRAACKRISWCSSLESQLQHATHTTHRQTHTPIRVRHLSVECVILYFRCSKFRTTTPRFFFFLYALVEGIPTLI